MELQEFKNRMWVMKTNENFVEINTFLEILIKRTSINHKVELITVLMIFQRMFDYLLTETLASSEAIFVVLYKKLVNKIKSYEMPCYLVEYENKKL